MPQAYNQLSSNCYQLNFKAGMEGNVTASWPRCRPRLVYLSLRLELFEFLNLLHGFEWLLHIAVSPHLLCLGQLGTNLLSQVVDDLCLQKIKCRQTHVRLCTIQEDAKSATAQAYCHQASIKHFWTVFYLIQSPVSVWLFSSTLLVASSDNSSWVSFSRLLASSVLRSQSAMKLSRCSMACG